MEPAVRVVSVKFRNYKALGDFELRLSDTSILVGPNNVGKSTLIGAFRVLAIALRRLKGKKPDIVNGPDGRRYGVIVPDLLLPISIENVHTDYSETDTTITFSLSNHNQLILYFPYKGSLTLVAETHNVPVASATSFRKAFPIDIAVVPVLGPVEHREKLVQEETVRDNLASHRASRNFRNYWYHYPQDFDAFASLIEDTWPGMKIARPALTGDGTQTLAMFCSENRFDRELYWVGSGFQVWCQLLTHLLRVQNATLVVIDEPEIYLHADLQRQLISYLRSLQADVLIATHSTEIVGEADLADLVLVEKGKKVAERLKSAEKLQTALVALGSVHNVTLSRLARSRKIIFVEGDKDYKLLRMFARQFGYKELASGLDIVPIPSEGFGSWEKVAATGWGIEKAMDGTLSIGAIYDRDYFPQGLLDSVRSHLSSELQLVHIHDRKEIENYLLVPGALSRALQKALMGKANASIDGGIDFERELTAITGRFKDEVFSQRTGKEIDFSRASGSKLDSATLAAQTFGNLSKVWNTLEGRLSICPGKAVLSELRSLVAERTGITLSDHKIISSMDLKEAPSDLVRLLTCLEAFRKGVVRPELIDQDHQAPVS